MKYLGTAYLTTDNLCHFEVDDLCEVYQYETGDYCLESGVEFSEKNLQNYKCKEYQIIFGNKFQYDVDEDDFELINHSKE